MIKIIKISTVPESLNVLLKGQLKYLNQYFNIIAVSGKGFYLQEVEEREGVNISPIQMQRKISPLKDLISLIKLYLYFIKEKPTIIHSITPKAGLLSMLAGKMAGVPIRMHTFTGLIFPTKTGLMKKILIKADQILCNAATNVYPEGEGVRYDLLKFKITDKPLKIIANGNINGIDLEYFNRNEINNRLLHTLKNKLKITDKDFVFIFVGRLVGDKGINELVKAYSKVRNIHTKLLLVGGLEEHLDPLWKETMKSIANSKDIISVGFQKDVRPYFAVSHVLVFPSYREGFPNVVMQAGAMGLPSIVTNINGCNEIIIEGQNGVIVPTKSEAALIKAMKSMVLCKDHYNHMKFNARKMIEERYEQSVVWNELRNEYDRLLKEKHHV